MGPLVLVSRYGFVIRIVPEDKIVDVENPHFISPLFNRAAGNHRFVIDPGYDLREPDNDRRLALIRKMLCKHGMFFYDLHPENIAKVPGYPDHLVIIDIDSFWTFPALRNSVDLLTRATKAVAKQLGIKSKPDPDNPQIALYKPLRDILEQAWPEDAPVPDPEGIHAFKERCLDFKARCLLRSDWEDPEQDYNGTWHIARLYDDHLKDYSWYDQNPPRTTII